MSFVYPFIYDAPGDRRGITRVGFAIRDNYLRWIATGDDKFVDQAIPDIAALIGKVWRKLVSSKPMDPDFMDPVAYKIILRFHSHTLPTASLLPRFLRLTIYRDLYRQIYKTYIPDSGDRSVRDFSYHPFLSPADIEHRIFIREIQELLLDHIEFNTRVEEGKRKACRYLAETMMANKMPSPLILKKKYDIPYKEQQFYVDFTTVILRNELYKLRDSLPHLYTDERKPFIPPGDTDEFETPRDQEEEVAGLCDL